MIGVDSSEKGYKFVGDVEDVSDIAGYVTPVPGGVGPMTVAMLLDNTVLSAERFAGIGNVSGSIMSFSHLGLFQEREERGKLEVKTPVPSDIEIARSVKPKKIGEVLSELGVKEEECEGYGNFKAKIGLEILERLDKESGNKGRYVVVAGYVSFLTRVERG